MCFGLWPSWSCDGAVGTARCWKFGLYLRILRSWVFPRHLHTSRVGLRIGGQQVLRSLGRFHFWAWASSSGKGAQEAWLDMWKAMKFRQDHRRQRSLQFLSKSWQSGSLSSTWPKHLCSWSKRIEWSASKWPSSSYKLPLTRSCLQSKKWVFHSWKLQMGDKWHTNQKVHKDYQWWHIQFRPVKK